MFSEIHFAKPGTSNKERASSVARSNPFSSWPHQFLIYAMRFRTASRCCPSWGAGVVCVDMSIT